LTEHGVDRGTLFCLDIVAKANVYAILESAALSPRRVRVCVALPVSLYSSNRVSMARIRWFPSSVWKIAWA
jgi:hypothetical protein